MLVVLCFWHSLIATLNFLNPISPKILAPLDHYVLIDRYVFYALFGVYITINIILIVWLITVPYKRRREMDYLDSQYTARKCIQLDTTLSRYDSRYDLCSRRASANNDTLSSIKSFRGQGASDGVIIIPSGTTVIPIREESHEAAGMDLDELHEQDDDYYDHTNDINHELRSKQISPLDQP